uniref:Uncharacterized protein LOC101300272 n=1 Tax=Rhizophora mucronata TaxID=61149 RepID=A0A2P2P2H8_RHIMU
MMQSSSCTNSAKPWVARHYKNLIDLSSTSEITPFKSLFSLEDIKHLW